MSAGSEDQKDIKNKADHHLRNIVDLLPTTDKQTRLRWVEELIFKLDLVLQIDLEKDYDITLDRIKINPNGDLTLDLISPSSNGEMSEVYKPPESFFGESSDAEKSNIWSGGVCVYYIAALSFPWKRASLGDTHFRRWVDKKVFMGTIDKKAKRALNCMLTVDWKERPCMKEVIREFCRPSPNSSVVGKLQLFKTATKF